jgi:signal transduction histidine kinase
MAGNNIWPIGDPAAEQRIATYVTSVFVVGGFAWVLASDLLLYTFTRDESVIARFETAKGYVFVALGGVLLYWLTRRSVVKLAEASRAVAAIVESIHDGVLLLGRDRTIAYANPASLQLLRTRKLSDLQGMNAQEFSRRFHVSYPDGGLIPPDQLISQRVFDEAGPMRYKAVFSPPEGSEIVLACTAAGVRSDIGMTADLVVSVFHDLTTIEQVERLRDELFTAAAHAMKTPVAVIKSAAQLVSAEGSPQVLRSTALIDRQCARINRMVDNLLVLSRIRSRTLQLHSAAIDLGSVLEDVVGENAELAREHPVDVRLDSQVRVRADRERMAMVLRNVIYAATRASRPDGAVAVRLKRGGNEAEIAVSFQPPPSDETVDKAPAVTEYDDIGVSRYVTTTIVEAHGGTLTEQAESGVTTIRINLPATREGGV